MLLPVFLLMFCILLYTTADYYKRAVMSLRALPAAILMLQKEFFSMD